jgi:hypothetical protein
MKTKIFLFVFILLPGISCQQADALTSRVNQSKIDNVKSLQGESQRLAYGMLNSSEKYFVWDQHLRDILNEVTLTQQQTALIHELKNLNSETLFRSTNANAQELTSNIIGSWLPKAEGHFSKDQIQIIAYKIHPNPKVTFYSQIPPCGCHQDSAYSCGMFEYCKGGQLCNPADDGCGFFWLQSCNGMCIKS